MPKQNFLGQKSQVKAGRPLVAVAIVVIGALIILGLIVLAQPVTNNNSNIAIENLNQNQNANNQVRLPSKNSTQIQKKLINLNFSLTNRENEAKEELAFTFDQDYLNNEYGFTVYYPQEYTYQEAKPADALLAVTFLGPTEDMPVITIYNDRSEAKEVENALVQNMSSSIKIEKKKYANIEATQITTSPPDATSTTGAQRVIWERDNYLFELTGVKSDDFLTEMLNSFAFI